MATHSRKLFLFLLAASAPFFAQAIDTDNDGLDDSVETNTGTYVSPTDTGTDPNVPDTDADGFNDGVEVSFGSNPVNANENPVESKVVASDAQADDSFGLSVSISGDTAVVGAPLEDSVASQAGAVYVYTRNGPAWSEQQKLTASDGIAGDQFGSSVSISGDTLFIGAQMADNGGADTGAVYIFERSGGVWSEQQKLASMYLQVGDRFGSSVVVSGNTAIIGASHDDHTVADEGSAFVFTRGVSSWTQQQQINGSDPRSGNRFGISVALSGDSAVIGSDLGDAGGAVGVDVGSAFVFTRSGSTWTEEQKLIASDFAADDAFGISVAISGDTVLVGAHAEDAGGSGAGAAYVFTRSGTTWSEQQKLVASDAAANDSFGYSMAVSGDIAVIGARLEDGGSFLAGSAYLFSFDGTSWSEQEKLVAADAQSVDGFAHSVSIDGSLVAIGANQEDAGGNNAGAAYLFNLDPDEDGLPSLYETDTGVLVDQYDTGTDPFIADSDGDGLVDGFEVSYGFDPHGTDESAGDGDNDGLNNVNEQASGTNPTVADTDGDGFSDGMEASFGTDPLDPLENPVESKLGASDAEGEDQFGWSVAVSGDTAVVGARYEDSGCTGGNNSGAVYVYTRSGVLWSEHQKLVPADSKCGDAFGSSVALSPDTLIIGATGDQIVSSNTGTVYVYVLSNGMWVEQQEVAASDAGSSDQFGYSVSVSGDSMVVGAHKEDGGGLNAGAAYVFTRTGNVWTEQQKLLANDAQPSDEFGYSVSISGDTVVAGAYLEDIAGFNAGAAYVFTRVGTVWSQQQKLLGSDTVQNDRFGTSVSISGGSILVGASSKDYLGLGSRGAAYVFTRSGTTWSEQQKLLSSDVNSMFGFGGSVSLAGDTAAIGTFGDDVHVFRRSGASWSLEQTFLAADLSQFEDSFGRSVATSGDVVIAGAYDKDGQVQFDETGAAYVFNLDQFLADTDGDGLLDGFEVQYGFDPFGTDESQDDNDGDGLNNLGEQAAGTHPHVFDTDSDGLSDGEEVNNYGTDPLETDTDMDGLSDGFEVANGTDPLVANEAINIPLMGIYGLLALMSGLLAVASRERGSRRAC